MRNALQALIACLFLPVCADWAWAARIFTPNYFDSTVSVIDTVLQKEISRIQVGKGPRDIALDPHAELGCVANSAGMSVSIFDLRILSETRKIPLPAPPGPICLSPDAATVYVSLRGEKAIGLYSVVNGGNLENYSLPFDPVHIVVPASGSRIEIDDRDGKTACLNVDGAVSRLEMRDGPAASAPSPAQTGAFDGEYMYLRNAFSVSVLSPSDGSLVSEIPAGRGEAGAVIIIDQGPPSPPTNLFLAVISNTQINLSWSEFSTDVTGFIIERSKFAPSAYAEIARVGAELRQYADTSLEPNTAYYYRIRAFNSSGPSLPSNEVGATTSGSSVTVNCFIATAVYGDPMHPDVVQLREFRDSTLMGNFMGRKVVALYYRLSPPIADWIEANGSVRPFMRFLFVPVVLFIKNAEPACLFLLIIVSALALSWLGRPRRDHDR